MPGPDQTESSIDVYRRLIYDCSVGHCPGNDPRGPVHSALSDLGMQAAEIRGLHSLLADACARQETCMVLDLAEDLISRHARFADTYRTILIIGPR